MFQCLNVPISGFYVRPYGNWTNFEETIRSLGLDGIEGIVDPDCYDESFPSSLLVGYHMTFYPDWVDFYRQNRTALLRKFGNESTVRDFYRSSSPDEFIRMFRRDFGISQKLHARYLVFHVSDVSLEEGYTYRWEHTDRYVLDASLEVINEILRGADEDFEFLVENQWWPGFTFTDPKKTEYLLSHIDYPKVGIMLDTGHLMNTEWKLKTQRQGVDYILSMIEKHGELSRYIRGLHFHQSLSGKYCRETIGQLPADFPKEYYEAFSVSYAHILHIDRHSPWTDPYCVRILDRVQPEYLSHELSSGKHLSQPAALKRQLKTIEKGRTDYHLSEGTNH
jgi:sugar phosphate isomerase/epimerase